MSMATVVVVVRGGGAWEVRQAATTRSLSGTWSFWLAGQGRCLPLLRMVNRRTRTGHVEWGGENLLAVSESLWDLEFERREAIFPSVLRSVDASCDGYVWGLSFLVCVFDTLEAEV